MDKKRNKYNKSTIVAFAVLLLCLLGIIGIFVWDLITRLSRGWNNNDTVTLVFFIMVAVAGTVVIKPFHEYFLNHNREIIMISNDIYRLFLEMEKKGSIRNYETFLIDRENKRYLEKINSIVQKKDANITITLDNIDEHFTATYGFYNGDVNIFNSYRLSSLYNKIKSNKSFNYEKLYMSVHNGELIKNMRFPLFESTVPLLIGLIGIFATIYQTLAIDESIQESLMEYLRLFGSFIALALAYTLLTYRSSKEGAINYKTNILTDLKTSKSDEID